jgi:hypothetical protein
MGKLTEIARRIGLDRVGVRRVEVVEDNVGVGGNSIRLSCQCCSILQGETYIDVVHKIHAHGKVDPGRLVNHRGTITRALYDIQLIRWSNAACPH